MDVEAAKVAITALLIRYASSIDRRDWVTFHQIFTPNCELEYGVFGRWHGADEATSAMEAGHARMGHTLHRISNVVADVDGDTATARAYVDGLLMDPDGRRGRSASGYYDDELVRSDQGWQISKRLFTLVEMHELPTADVGSNSHSRR